MSFLSFFGLNFCIHKKNWIYVKEDIIYPFRSDQLSQQIHFKGLHLFCKWKCFLLYLYSSPHLLLRMKNYCWLHFNCLVCTFFFHSVAHSETRSLSKSRMRRMTPHQKKLKMLPRDWHPVGNQQKSSISWKLLAHFDNEIPEKIPEILVSSTYF